MAPRRTGLLEFEAVLPQFNSDHLELRSNGWHGRAADLAAARLDNPASHIRRGHHPNAHHIRRNRAATVRSKSSIICMGDSADLYHLETWLRASRPISRWILFRSRANPGFGP